MSAQQTLLAVADDGIQLHVEVTGAGLDVLFLHEFSGDHRSWAGQVQQLARRYRCITYAARGYAPSDVPAEPSTYTQAQVARDALSVLDAVGAGPTSPTHLVGLSMGAFTALNLAIAHPGRVRSVVAASCGYGADVPGEQFRAEMDEMAAQIRRNGCGWLAELTGASPYRRALADKDPAAFDVWQQSLAEHDPIGQAHTLQGVQRNRPTLLELVPRLAPLSVPLLFIAGDEDDPLLAANVTAKLRCPSAGLLTLPRTAHTVNLEEPAAFNRAVLDFLSWVDAGTWPRRDPGSQAAAGGWIR